MYQATVNFPGYLPMDDEIHLFETAFGAWEWLADQRNRDLGDDENDDSSNDVDECFDKLWKRTQTSIYGGVGTVFGRTPGYTGDHDLGLAYSVVWIDDPTISLEINVRTVTPYDDAGRWMEGDTRVIRSQPTQNVTPDLGDLEECQGDIVAWAVACLRPLGSFEASVYPLGTRLAEHVWLLACEDSPIDATMEETTVRIYGVTQQQRAEIFRGVTA